MADEIRVTRDEDATLVGDRYASRETVPVETVPVEPAPAVRPAPAVVATTGTVTPDDPEAAREQIEHTRQRMSETIDEIEDVLLRKKERLQERLDVTAPMRERPLPTLGIALGAGLLLGVLTGGDDEEDDRPARYDGGRHADLDAERRAEMWEERARRLLRIAQEQEDELESLRGTDARRASEEFSHLHEDEGGKLADLRDKVVAGLSGYVTTAIHDLMGTRASR